MPVQILSPDQIIALTKIRLGIVGLNGVGKTTFLTTIPREERVFHVGVDIENIRPVAKLPHFRIGRITRWNDLLDVYEMVGENVTSGRAKNPITVLTFDTWSRIQDLAIGKVTGYEPSDPEKLRQYIERIPKQVRGWEGWGQVGSLLNEWMANFNRLPVHIIYLMQELDRKDRVDPTEWETGPRLTPEAAKGIKDSLEIIGRLYVELGDEPVIATTNGKEELSDEEAANLVKNAVAAKKSRALDPNVRETRKLFVGKDERYFAKGPSHLLGRVVSNPRWDNVVVPVLTQTPLPGVAARMEREEVAA